MVSVLVRVWSPWQITPTNITCHCYNLAAALTSVSMDGRRRRLATTEVLVADLALVTSSSASDPSAEALSPSSGPPPITSSGSLTMIFIAIGSVMGLVSLLFSIYAYRTLGTRKKPRDKQLKVASAPHQPTMGKQKIVAT